MTDLAEAYTYDSYGQVSPWGYRAFDFFLPANLYLEKWHLLMESQP